MVRYVGIFVLVMLAVIAAVDFALGLSGYAWAIIGVVLAVFFGLPVVDLAFEYWFGPPPPDVVAVEDEQTPPWIHDFTNRDVSRDTP